MVNTTYGTALLVERLYQHYFALWAISPREPKHFSVTHYLLSMCLHLHCSVRPSVRACMPCVPCHACHAWVPCRVCVPCACAELRTTCTHEHTRPSTHARMYAAMHARTHARMQGHLGLPAAHCNIGGLLPRFYSYGPYIVMAM